MLPRLFVYPSAKECYPPCQWVLQFKGESIIDEWILKSETVAKSKKYYAHFDCRTDHGNHIEKNIPIRQTLHLMSIKQQKDIMKKKA